MTIRRVMGALLGAWILLASLSVQAAIETYDFQQQDGRERFKELTEVLRCPKCQNNNLADSNAPIAKDMRREIHRMLEEGQADTDIVQFMVDRYGDFVNYRPRRDASTLVLWYGPIALLVIGMLVVWVISRRRKSSERVEKEDKTLSETEQERLQRLLNSDKSDD